MDWANPHFAEPRWLWLAIVGGIALWLLQRYAELARRRQLSQLAAPEFVAELTRSHSRLRRAIKHLLLLGAVAGMGVALARPQWGQQSQTSQALGHDVIFLLDCSRSMLAADVLPSRLQRSKLAILDFVQQQAHGRVGLVAFAGQAFLQCPLTYDYGAFGEALNGIDDKTIPVPGTDLGRALQEAFHAVDKAQRQKVFVLITDGEDLEKGGVRTSELLAKEGVVVFTIGVGTPGGAEIQVINEQGRPELLRDSKGEVVRSRLDEPTLRAIAEASRGAYYGLGPLGEGLARVRLALEKFSGGSSGSVPSRKLGIDRFHVPLTLALVLLVTESLIGTRMKAGRKRADMPPRTAIKASMLILSAAALVSWAPKANAAVTLPPETPREFYNAGTAKLKEGKLREAEALLQTALAAQNDKVQPSTLYNLGHTRFNQGLEELKKGPTARNVSARAKSIIEQADAAIQSADEALAGTELKRLVESYLNGRGSRRELREATKLVRRALQTHEATLSKWERAAGDFKSAFELNPADQKSRDNAEIVDQYIAKLVDSIKELQQAASALGQKKEELGEKMKQLRGRIPDEEMPPGAPGDDEEEEEQPMGTKPGEKEAPSQDGQEMMLPEDMAGWLLESFKLDTERRLPMGQKDTAEPKDRLRKPW